MLNMGTCVMCGSNDVANKELTVPINVNGIVSVTVKGAECVKCGEKYYDLKDLKAIEEMQKSMEENAVSA